MYYHVSPAYELVIPLRFHHLYFTLAHRHENTDFPTSSRTAYPSSDARALLQKDIHAHKHDLLNHGPGSGDARHGIQPHGAQDAADGAAGGPERRRQARGARQGAAPPCIVSAAAAARMARQGPMFPRPPAPPAPPAPPPPSPPLRRIQSGRR